MVQGEDHALVEMRRVLVLGATGSGKSTLAAELARRIGAPHIELDAFQHGPDWTPRSKAEFEASVAAIAELPIWVVDGNYIDRVKTSLWPLADTAVWLDLPLPVIVFRVIRRTVRRIARRTVLWNGNRERWSALFGSESLLKWTVQSHRRQARELPGLLDELAEQGTRVSRLHSGWEAKRWASAVSPTQV